MLPKLLLGCATRQRPNPDGPAVSFSLLGQLCPPCPKDLNLVALHHFVVELKALLGILIRFEEDPAHATASGRDFSL